MIGAYDATFTRATGKGVRVGVIDSDVAIKHPDIAPNLDLDASCSFITLDRIRPSNVMSTTTVGSRRPSWPAWSG